MGVGARLSFRERLQPLVRLMVAHQPQPLPPSIKHDKRGEEKKWGESVTSCQRLRAFCSGVDVGMDGGIKHATRQFISHHRPNIRFPKNNQYHAKRKHVTLLKRKMHRSSMVLHRPTVHKTQLLGPNEAPSCQWTPQTQLKSFLY